jgi:hypothetical protein
MTDPTTQRSRQEKGDTWPCDQQNRRQRGGPKILNSEPLHGSPHSKDDGATAY